MNAGKWALGISLICLLGVAWNMREANRTAASLQVLPKVQERLEKLEAQASGLGEIMSGIQMHFAKLYFAAENGNWDLAKFELEEIGENMQVAAVLRPTEGKIDLKSVFDAFLETQFAGLQDAVAKKDLDAFHKAYKEGISACNGCHATTQRPFLVITEPDRSPVPNQRWVPLTK